MQNICRAKTVMGVMVAMLIAAIAVVASPVAAAVNTEPGFASKAIEKPAAYDVIAATKKKKKKKKTRYPSGNGS